MLVAGDVLGDVGAGTFGVAHLAEDTSARAGDAFDGFERSVGIELDAVRGRTALIMGSDPIMCLYPAVPTQRVGGSAQLNRKGRVGAEHGPTGSRSRRSDKTKLPDVIRRYFGQASKQAPKSAED